MCHFNSTESDLRIPDGTEPTSGRQQAHVSRQGIAITTTEVRGSVTHLTESSCCFCSMTQQNLKTLFFVVQQLWEADDQNLTWKRPKSLYFSECFLFKCNSCWGATAVFPGDPSLLEGSIICPLHYRPESPTHDFKESAVSHFHFHKSQLVMLSLKNTTDDWMWWRNTPRDKISIIWTESMENFMLLILSSEVFPFVSLSRFSWWR